MTRRNFINKQGMTARACSQFDYFNFHLCFLIKYRGEPMYMHSGTEQLHAVMYAAPPLALLLTGPWVQIPFHSKRLTVTAQVRQLQFDRKSLRQVTTSANIVYTLVRSIKE